MNFLADESCDFTVVRALRDEGHEVMAVAEISPAADDEDIIGLAYSEAKILLTEDKDFGRLVYSPSFKWRGLNPFSLKYPQHLAQSDLNLVRDMEDQWAGCFVVVEPGRTRINRSIVE